MKNISLTTIIFFLYIIPGFSQQNLTPAYPKEINYREGIAYFNGTPFTGLLVDERTNKKIGKFITGYKNGEFIEYYKNGTIKTKISYIDGKIADGDYTVYDENGEITSIKTYKNNTLLAVKKNDGSFIQYYESGKIRNKSHLNKNGIQDGPFTEWWENGSKKAEGYKVNGKLNGKLISWDENSRKKSEQFFSDGKKDSISVFWEGKGIIKTQYYKNDILIKEEIKNQNYLISNYSLNKHEYLYYYLNGIKQEKVFVLIKINDRSLEYDELIRKMANNLLSDIQQRLVYINDKSIYDNEYISYIVEISDLMYHANGKYDDAGDFMYTGSSTYRIKLFDNLNRLLYDDKFDSDEISRSAKSFSWENPAYKQGVKKAHCTDYVYKYFPVRSEIVEITLIKGNNRAKKVKICSGVEMGVKKNMRFNVSVGDTKPSIIGELEVIEVYPKYSECKVTLGGEDILNIFNSGKKLKIISKL